VLKNPRKQGYSTRERLPLRREGTIMVHGRARDERKERLWRRWIGEWQTSGLSARAFCQRRRLTVASFYAWRRVLQRRDAEKAAFVPVQVVADAVADRASAVEVVLTDGRTVRVAPGFDTATLRQVLAVLEGRPC
jgi:hypothetical protein